MSIAEKEAALKIEEEDATQGYIEYDEQETRKILWKVDWRLVPFLALLYLYVSFLFCPAFSHVLAVQQGSAMLPSSSAFLV